MIPIVLSIIIAGCGAARAQVDIYDGASIAGWRATVDNDAPGADQSLDLAGNEGETWLRWTVTTNSDREFTGYGASIDVDLDLSEAELLKWRWFTTGKYLQLQLWSGDKLAYWDTGSLQSGEWRTESASLADFHVLGGFGKEDWASITKIGLRIADRFAGYREDTEYEIGLQFIRGYGPIGPPESDMPPMGTVSLEETDDALVVASDRYRLELRKSGLGLQLSLADGEGGFSPVSISGLFYGFDVEGGNSMAANPVYEVLSASHERIVIAAAAELELPTRDALLVTFTCLGDRFYTTVNYQTPLEMGRPSTRFAPSGDVTKGMFSNYAFRDVSGALHRGSFDGYRERAGFGISTFDTKGDRASGFNYDKPYLYVYDPGVPRGLAVVYMDYADVWQTAVTNCHFTYYTDEMDYFHLGLARSGCDCAPERTACFYVDITGDLATIDKVAVPQILLQARRMDLRARKPEAFTIRTDEGEQQRAVLRRLKQTWGNHMHWIGVGWGGREDDVLATSIDQTETMLSYGARGGINFDMVGIERLAENDRGSIEQLRRLLKTGDLEVVGATYAQPLGSLHGPEPNIRQLQWGVRVCEQCLGVTPEVWWEEEYYFFPQLPQLLSLMGFKGACLYFQRTWIPPKVPVETDTAVVNWQSPDGSEMQTAAYTPAVAWMARSPDPNELASMEYTKNAEDPLLIEWNELTGSEKPTAADQLKSHYRVLDRLGMEPTTLGGYLESYDGPAPARRYRMDQTFSGLTWGRGGGQIRRADKRIEHALLAAEAFGAAASIEGAQYPEATLRDAWKNLMIFQGHDVHICEGCLQGRFPQYMNAADEISRQALQNSTRYLAERVATRDDAALAGVVVFNSLSWSRSGPVRVSIRGDADLPESLVARTTDGTVVPCQRIDAKTVLFVARQVPPVGYRIYWLQAGAADTDLRVGNSGRRIANGSIALSTDGCGNILSLRAGDGAHEYLSGDAADGRLVVNIGGQLLSSAERAAAAEFTETGPVRTVLQSAGQFGDYCDFVNRTIVYSRLPMVVFETDLRLHRELPGLMMGALRRVFTPAFEARYFHDWPFGLSETEISNEFPLFHPYGFGEETVRNHVTGLNLLDCQGDGRGLLYAHDGNQGFLRDGDRIANLLSTHDPWDRGYNPQRQSFRSALIAHGEWANSDRLRAALGFNTPLWAVAVSADNPGDLPPEKSWLNIDLPQAVVSTLHRDNGDLIVRLYDVDGQGRMVRMDVGATIASARTEDLRGNALRQVDIEGNVVQLQLRPYEIATVRLKGPRE